MIRVQVGQTKDGEPIYLGSRVVDTDGSDYEVVGKDEPTDTLICLWRMTSNPEDNGLTFKIPVNRLKIDRS